MSPFKTPDGEAKYLAAYDATLKTWPVSSEARDVPTRFGTTHVNVAGPQDAPPLFLVHGFGFSSTQWYPNIAALSREHRVYAPDVIDQYGRSNPTQVLRTREDYAAWYGDVLDGLGVPRADLAGHSYGGWLTLNFALAQPERVRRLALLSPAASFVPMTKEFYIRGMAANLLLSDWAIYGMVQWMTTVG
jgi:pimeloyl-ACP methyl ester carboxylesterase